MKIARVFPTKTSNSPDDPDAYFGPPELFMPDYDEIHVSVAFTWDIKRARELKKQWEAIAPVKIGGPAIDGEGDSFTPGQYLRKGITITSRGCPNSCPWCFVKKPLTELEIHPGSNLLDNNILACSKNHQDKVFQMLASQFQIHLNGGLEAARIDDYVIERLRGIRIRRLFVAYDHPSSFKQFKRAVTLLRKYFDRWKVRCYVLVGFGNDTPEKAEARLIQAWEAGTLPYAMLYRNKGGDYPTPNEDWRRIQRIWVRPPRIAAYAAAGFRDTRKEGVE